MPSKLPRRRNNYNKVSKLIKEDIFMVQTLTKKRKRNNAGFTLIELIVVIAILGILAAILVPMVTGYIGKAKDQAYEADAHTAFTAAAATQAQSNASYTSYKESDTTSGDAVMGEADLASYLGSHGNFSVTGVTFDSTNGYAVTSVTISEGGKTIVYDATKTGNAQYSIS